MVHRRHDITAIVFVVICIAAYASIRSEFRLRHDMPVEFFDASRIPVGKRASEEKIARAYWNCAVTQVQWKYGYAHRLPEEPPDDFSLTPETARSAATDSALRERYWQKLRVLWGVSTMWEKHYEWNNDTLKNSMQSGGAWLERLGRRIIS
jgi:hypothetical protein